MSEVIPSFYEVEAMGGGHHGGVLPLGNTKLRYGEVKKEILPSSKESRSKKYREYEVLVQHYEDGGATHRMYHNCIVLNDLCGAGDYSFMSLRESNKKGVELGNGSRVFLLCVEGNDSRAVIIGGPQQHKDTSLGVHKEFQFNGVNFQINSDGSWKITNNGKTDNEGNLHKDADSEGVGTSVEVEANGNFNVSTKNGKCSLSINHKDGSITVSAPSSVTVKTSSAKIDANSSVTVKAPSVSLDGSRTSVGNGAVSHAVLGEQLVAVLTQVFGTIIPTLPTPAQQAAAASAAAQLFTILSKTVTVAS